MSAIEVHILGTVAMADLEEIRSGILALHELPNTDAEYTIYYDESNNVRKLRLTQTGLNIGEPVCFALAGIFYEGPPRKIEFDRFRTAARISANEDEIKFGMLANGEFMRCMGSQKIENFLDWMQEEGLLIHYQSTDVLYWSIVDIVDSIGAGGMGGLIGHRMDIDMAVKDVLYGILRDDLPTTTRLLHGFGYPDVGPMRRVEFLDALISLVKDKRSAVYGRLSEILLMVLRQARKLDSLPFLEGEAAGELISSLMDFYLHRIALFNRSHHILDDEAEVERAMTDLGPQSGGRPVQNYRFADSKSEPGIQASDVVAGLMGKLFNYVIRTPAEQIRNDVRSANPRQARNLSALRTIIDRAHQVSPAFAHAIMAIEDRRRAGILLD